MGTNANWNFLVEETSATNGNPYRIQNRTGSCTIVLSFEGTATAYSAVLEAKGLVGDYVAIYGWDETNKTLISTATEATGKLITIDGTAKDYFRVRLSAVSGGNLSVSGKAVE
jgi:hypothetical protein